MVLLSLTLTADTALLPVFFDLPGRTHWRLLQYSVTGPAVAVELPWLAVPAVVMTGVTYPMLGFAADAGKFFYFLALLWLNLTMYCFLGQFFVYATPTPVMAQLLAASATQVRVFLFLFLTGII